MSKNKVLRAVFIDEAHCIKKYGRGDGKEAPFRPLYGQLGELRSLVNKTVPVVALTATATAATRAIIMKELCMEHCVQIIVDPNKHNVKYTVEQGVQDACDNFRWLVDLVATKGIDCPRIIIFFRQIKHIAEVFEYLQTNLGGQQYVDVPDNTTNGYWNRLFAMFHLTTNDKIKNAVCESFLDPNGVVRVVLCSTSFSMGLDVKSVHTVVHFGPANDVDDYLQESGRAGRNPAEACNAIMITYRYCLNSSYISKSMKDYVKAKTCRRMFLLKPFSSDARALEPKHACCDICAVDCHCLCKCSVKCTCDRVCQNNESLILQAIRSFSLNDENEAEFSENEEFLSDSEMEKYKRQKPQIMDSSEDEI